MATPTPFIWFDGTAEDAARFYAETFDGAKLGNITHYGKTDRAVEGSVLTAEFEINGLSFVGLNGGSHFKLTPAVSFMITCDTQEQIDRYWDKLTDGGETMACGWVTDKFGVTWQITPSMLMGLLFSDNPAKSQAAMQAMESMVKLDIAEIQKAYDEA
ncbi:MAG TPA: VOC family protein [Capsulimonadaceae bacterium]|jgi:predicted 3-demethylubiquinone-9 3-methyltransferase (glyoxalase superfamily)